MRSARFRPAPATRTRASPGPGAGTGRSATSSRPSTIVSARIPAGYVWGAHRRTAAEMGRSRDRYRRGVAGSLSIMDDDGSEVVLDRWEAESLLKVAGRLDAATVSACADCRSRV